MGVRSGDKAHEIDSGVGRRVRGRRIELGLSQTALGDAVGVTFQQIQKYEKGTNRIGASRLQQISDVLKVSPSYFFHVIAGPTNSHSASEIDALNSFVADKHGHALMRAFMNIRSASVRREITKLVGSIADNVDR
jgi:transcriptional regulator with XRE-family HTH domain